MTRAAAFDLRQWMSPETAAAFDGLVRRRSYADGQFLYQQGEPGDEMFRIVEGKVRLSVSRSDGREIVFLYFGPGDCFGDSSLVDREPRPQTAEATSALLVEVLDRVAFDRLRLAHRQFDEAMMRLLARQMRVVSSHYVDTSLDDLPTRVATRILEVAAPADGDPQARGELGLRLSQTDLASMVGASRQSVNRTLQRLQADGLIVIEYNNVRICDEARLRQIVRGEEIVA